MDYTMLQGRAVTTRHAAIAKLIACPKCRANKNWPCTSATGKPADVHKDRVDALIAWLDQMRLIPKVAPHQIIGRIAWDRDNEHHTPWVLFANITDYRTWARDMRKALGFQAKSEYHLIGTHWTAKTLLDEASNKGDAA